MKPNSPIRLSGLARCAALAAVVAVCGGWRQAELSDVIALTRVSVPDLRCAQYATFSVSELRVRRGQVIAKRTSRNPNPKAALTLTTVTLLVAVHAANA